MQILKIIFGLVGILSGGALFASGISEKPASSPTPPAKKDPEPPPAPPEPAKAAAA
jgi:hypothetical protein